MTPKPKSSLISKIDCARAIETFLAAGMVWSPDAPSDVAAITDAYYYALKDLTKDQLDKGIERVITDTRGDARPWVPAANKVRWAIERAERADQPAAARMRWVTVDRVFAIDEKGPLVRTYGEEEHTDYPLPADVRCPLEGCGCVAVDVWERGALFGGLTNGWGARMVWDHIAREKQMQRVKDGLPTKEEG